MAEGTGCCGSFAKCILIIFNIVFWIAGAVVLGVGIWMLADKNALSMIHVATQQFNNADALLKVAAYCLIAVGGVAFLTGFLGCCGAMTNNTCMLCTYALILSILVILQFCAGIFMLAFRNKIIHGIKTSLEDSIQNKYGQQGSEAVTNGVDIMQRELKCCGSDGYNDWKNSTWRTQQTNAKVPMSCCILNEKREPVDKNCQVDPKASTTYTEGCHGKLTDWVRSHASIIMGVAFGLIGVQILGIILACCLRRSLRNQYQYV